MWADCRKLMQIPGHVYIDDSLWGHRGTGALNTKSMYTYNQVNPFYILSTRLKSSSRVMADIISEQRRRLAQRKDGKLCIFLISSQVTDEVDKPVLHTNVFVAKLINKETTCKPTKF